MPDYTVAITDDQDDVLENMVDDGMAGTKEEALDKVVEQGLRSRGNRWEADALAKVKKNKPAKLKKFLKDES